MDKQLKNDQNRKTRGRLHLKKGDLILAAVLIVAFIISYIVIEFGVKKQGEVVEIKIDGNVQYEFKLDEDKEITVDGYQGGMNTIVIRNKTVFMTDADCPDKICVHTAAISKTGETIVCLPHRVVVEIKGNEKAIDSVVN